MTHTTHSGEKGRKGFFPHPAELLIIKLIYEMEERRIMNVAQISR